MSFESIRSHECPFPIWSIFITTESNIPSNIRPGTFRVPFGKGRTLVCVDDSSSTTNKPEQTLWEATIATMSVAQWDGSSVTVARAGTNFQPSITAYIWKRVASLSDVTVVNGFNVPTEWEWAVTDRQLYWDNVIIDWQTLKPKQPNPYNMTSNDHN